MGAPICGRSHTRRRTVGSSQNPFPSGQGACSSPAMIGHSFEVGKEVYFHEVKQGPSAGDPYAKRLHDQP